MILKGEIYHNTKNGRIGRLFCVNALFYTYSETNGMMDYSVDFILGNFSEMNKLWLQYQGSSQKRECFKHEERKLHILVGMNLVRLSQLQSIDVTQYKNVCNCV